jgi:hypothetical protein
MSKRLLVFLAICFLGLVNTGTAGAQSSPPGTQVGDCVPANASGGVSVAFDGEFLYYTNFGGHMLWRADPHPDGTCTFAGGVPITGQAVFGVDAFSYDASRDLFWAASSDFNVYTMSKTGVTTFAFTTNGNRPGECDGGCIPLIDGIAFDAGAGGGGGDDTVWYSPDISRRVYQYETDGTFVSSFSVANMIPECNPPRNSGIGAGAEDLYLTASDCGRFFRYSKTGVKKASFAYNGQRAEDLECDDITFQNDDVMWVRDAFDGHIRAFALPAATCFFGGGQPQQEPTTIILTESPGHSPVNEVGTRHCVTATVLDQDGEPIAGITVSFDVEGSSDEPVPFGDAEGSATTDQGGMAEFCYDGPDLPGQDTIVAFIDEDGDHIRDTGELQSRPLTKTWIPPATTPGCEINISNGGWITTATGSKGSFGGNAKAELDLTVKGSQEYQDHGLIPINVKSVEIVSIVCDGDTRAEIYGTATINGLEPPVDFRIVVPDLGEPGSKDAPRDTYQIITGAYTSGAEDNPLQGGNVQIHRFS